MLCNVTPKPSLPKDFCTRVCGEHNSGDRKITQMVAQYLHSTQTHWKLLHLLTKLAWWLLSIGLFVMVWEIGYWAGWLDPLLFPPPHIFIPIIFDSPRFQPFGVGYQGVDEEISNFFLLRAVGATFLRVAIGLLIGYASGVVVGFLIHYQRWFGYISTPMLRLMASISAVAWFPLVIAILRSGEYTAIALVALAVFFPLTLAVSETVQSVPPTFVNAARVIGASRRQIFLGIVLPYCQPQLYRLMRINFFGAWMTILLSELFDVKIGLGIFIFLSRAYLNSELAWALVVIIGACGYTADLIMRWIGERLFWYETATTSKARM
jgi:NitT/TauT family transport system permease protein